MSDITIAELAAAIPDGDAVKTWWTEAAAIPGVTTVNEFFAKTLKGASDAQRAKNASLAAGARIDGYPAPTNGAVTIDAATGTQSYVATFSVRSRVAVNLDIAVSPLA